MTHAKQVLVLRLPRRVKMLWVQSGGCRFCLYFVYYLLHACHALAPDIDFTEKKICEKPCKGQSRDDDHPGDT